MEKEIVRNENNGYGLVTYGVVGNAIITPVEESFLLEQGWSREELEDAKEIDDDEWESHVTGSEE